MAQANGNSALPTSGRDTAGRFTGGNKIATGRPKGNRNKLSEAFLGDLHKAWLKHGKKVLEHCARTAPETFLRAATAVLPRALEVESRVVTRSELSIEVNDFRQAWENWGRVVGAEMPDVIEAEPVEDADD